MTLKHTKKTCQNGALGVTLTIAMGRPDDLAITPAEVLVVRIEDDPRVFLGSRIASHEVDPAGKGLPRRSSCLELSGPHHWYKGSQPSPRSAVLSADTSVVLSTVARSMTHSMLPSKTQS